MRESLKIPVMRRRALWWAWAVLLFSGLVWLGAEGLLRADEELERAFAWKRLSLAVHGAGAFVFLLAVGALWPHLTAGLAQARNRASGFLNIGLLLLLVASAWWLYYGPGDSRDLGSVFHWVLGLAASFFLPMHAWLGRRSRKYRRRQP